MADLEGVIAAARYVTDLRERITKAETDLEKMRERLTTAESQLDAVVSGSIVVGETNPDDELTVAGRIRNWCIMHPNVKWSLSALMPELGFGLADAQAARQEISRLVKAGRLTRLSHGCFVWSGIQAAP